MPSLPPASRWKDNVNIERGKFEQVLDACLDQVLHKGGSLELCLEQYPEHAAELEPLLRVAVESKQQLDFRPSLQAKARARTALHQAIQNHEANRYSSTLLGYLRKLSTSLSARHRWAVSATAGMIILAFTSTGLVTASNNSTPDQHLYPVKRAVEQTQVFFTRGDQSRADLYAKFAERRLAELEVLGARGNMEHVSQLTQDLDYSLKQVRFFAIPGVRVFYLDDGTHVPTEFRPIFIQGSEIRQPPLNFRLDPTALENLQRLHAKLQRDFNHRAPMLYKVFQNAPPSVQTEVVKAQQITEREYRGLIYTIKLVMEEGS